MSIATNLSADDFWTLLRQSRPVPPWPRYFDTIWPDPRPERAGVEHPVLVEVLDVEGKIPRVDGEEPWLELRCLRLAIRARDYDKYKFELLVVPVPRELYELVQLLDDRDDRVDELIMAWTEGAFCAAFRTVRLCLRQVGSPVQCVIDWFPDDQPAEYSISAPAGHHITPEEEAAALRAQKMFGQLVNNMTLRGAPRGNANRQRYSPGDQSQFRPDLRSALDGAIHELLQKDIHPSDIPSRIKVTTIARHWPEGIDRKVLGKLLKERNFNIETSTRNRLRNMAELKSPLGLDAPKTTS